MSGQAQDTTLIFQPYVEGPASSFDLLAIAPFLLAAMVVAGLRRMKRSHRRDDE